MKNVGYRVDLERQSIVYAVDAPEITNDVRRELENRKFRIKDECHITVLPSEVGASVDPYHFAQITRSIGWLATPNFDYTNELYKISKDKHTDDGNIGRSSVIAPVNLKNRPIIEWQVATLLGDEIDMPTLFPHVTIATSPDTEIARRGIGISSIEEWEVLRPSQSFAKDWLIGPSGSGK